MSPPEIFCKYSKFKPNMPIDIVELVSFVLIICDNLTIINII